MQLKGRATVTEISDCPPIAAGEGAVVTGRFVTLRVNRLIRLTMTGDVELVGTPSHPIWSADRQDWVPLGELIVGEKLRSRTGIVRAEQIEVLDEEASVYNIEVHGQHVYEVTALGILVHNPDADCVKWHELRERQRTVGLNPAEQAELDQLTDTLIDRRQKGTLNAQDMQDSGLSKSEIDEIDRKARDTGTGKDASADRLDAPNEPLGRGSTVDPAKGRHHPRNLREQLAIDEAMQNPKAGVDAAGPMGDSRWPASEGWVKKQQTIYPGGGEGPVSVHYNYNTKTGASRRFQDRG